MRVHLNIIETLKPNFIEMNVAEKNKDIIDIVEYIEGKFSTLKVKNGDKDMIIKVKTVSRIFSAAKKIYVENIEKQDFTSSVRLYQFEIELPKNFVRISNTEIINLEHTEKFQLTKSGVIEIELKNGTVTSSSRRYLKSIKERLM